MVYNLENFLDMTTLIWEGDLFYDVHLISPAKFWKRSTIPLDVFVDFWNIVVEPDEELKKKTKRKDAMSDQGRLKVINGDKEYIAEDGDQIHLYPSTLSRYWIEPYEEEIDSLDFCIVHGWEVGLCHFKLEIDGDFEREKLTYDPKTSTVLYDGKEFELMPYCVEKKEWDSFCPELSHFTGWGSCYLYNDNRYVHAYKRNKNGMKELKMGKFCVFLDRDGNELVPNYGYEKTIQPDQKNYQPLFRKDTVERIKKESMVWDYEKRENIHVFVSDPNSKHFDGYLARL